MALWRTSDLGMGRCRCSLDDVHGPLEHERPASSSLQGPCALILGQPPRARQKPNKAALGYPKVLIAEWKYASRCWNAVSSVQRLRYNRAIRLAEALRRGILVRMYSTRSPSRVA